MNRASAFGRGSWVSQQNTYTAISYDIYKGKPQDVDLDAVTTGDLKRYSHIVPAAGHATYMRRSGTWPAIRRPTTPTCGTR